MTLGSAQAGQAHVFAGYDRAVNDPFVVRRGLHVGAGFAPNEVLSFDTGLYGYPDLGEADWTPLTRQLINEARVSPDISKITARGDLVVRIAPFSREWEWLHVRTGFHAGVGFVRTKDDLEALQAEGDPRAMSTELQLHPTAISGVHAEVRTPYVVGLRVKLETVRFNEAVNGTTVEMKANRFAGMEVTAWFP